MAWHMVRPPQDTVAMRHEKAVKQDQTQVIIEAAAKAKYSGPPSNVMSRLVRESLVREYFEIEDEEKLDVPWRIGPKPK